MDEVKKKLKRWEYYFYKCHQRKPLKEDVDSAPADIKDGYRLYYKFKSGSVTTVQTDSTNLENVSDVWGEHVSAKALKQERIQFLENGDVKVVKEDNSSKVTEKWAEKFSKKLTGRADRLKLPGQLATSKAIKHENDKLKTDSAESLTQISLPSIRVRKPRVRSVPQGWKDIALPLSVEKLEGDFGSLDGGNAQAHVKYQPSKGISQQVEMTGNADKKEITDKPGSTVATSDDGCKVATSITSESQSFTATIADTPSSAVMCSSPFMHLTTVAHSTVAPSPTVMTSKATSLARVSHSTNTKVHDSPSPLTSNPGNTPAMSSRYQVFKMKSVPPLPSGDPDPYDFTDEENVPSKPSNCRTKTKVTKTASAIKSSERKPSKRSTKRKNDTLEKNTTQDSTDEPQEKKTRTATASSSRKTGSSSVNDNFVKLNLRKKVFSRGKVGLKGAAYKRQQWRNKMSAKCGTACFKCGEEGHWASKCPNGGGASNAKEKEEVFNEDEDGFLVDKPADEYLDDLMLGAYTGEKKEVSGMQAESSCLPLYDETDKTACQRKVRNVLHQVFGFESFRPGQMETVVRMLQGKSTLVMLSTGAGKSLCYQLPAYLYAERGPSIAVVISPLVSLMEDQVTDLPRGINGVCLHTNQTDSVRTKIMNSVLEGNQHFLLCSPEFMCSTSRSNIEFLNKLPPISFACIDEAHCLSEWSHNFRPSYLRVCKILRVRFGVKCFLGLTATATKETVNNISSHLNLQDCETDCIKGTILPPNLNLSVSRDAHKEQALLDLLQSKRFQDCQSVIIYCTRREQTDRLASVIRTVLPDEKSKDNKKCVAESYHAGLSAAQRRRIQKQFMNGRLRIVVATVAFGMGLDKSDVRAVIHYTLPKGFESYVQEIGRAGRDGLPAECHLFLEPECTDVSELEKHTYADSVDQSALRKLLSMIYTQCKCQMLADAVDQSEGKADSRTNVCPGHERVVVISKAVEQLNITEQGLATLLFYLELRNSDWLENQSNVYSACSIKCYGGLSELHRAAKKCIPLGVAMALRKKQLGNGKLDAKDFSFSIIDVANLLNKPSGYIKKELKQLQWHQTADGKYKRTGIMVEFGDLAIRVKVPGNLSDQDLDEILGFLRERVKFQETKEVTRLNYFYHILDRLAYKDYFMVSETADQRRSDSLKQSIRDYFESCDPVKDYTLELKIHDGHEREYINSQVTNFISTYSSEHDFTGRDVAKILYGIASPNFPPNVWGRVRKYWRSLIGYNFNTIVKVAGEQLISMRG